MHSRDGAKFCGLLFGRSVAEKVSAADLRAGKVLQEIRAPKRRMELDMKMKSAIVAIVCRRLVQRHDVRKRRLPKIVKTYHGIFQHFSEVQCLGVAECGDALAALLRSDEDFISVTRKIRKKSNRCFVLRNNPRSVALFGGDNI